MQSETPQSTLIIVQISNSLTSLDMAQSSSQECVGGRLNIHMCLCVPVLTGKGEKMQQKAAKYPDVKLTHYFAFKSSSLLFQSTWMPLKSMQILHLKNCFTQVRCWISRTELLFSENYSSSLQCLCFAFAGCSGRRQGLLLLHWQPGSYSETLISFAFPGGLWRSIHKTKIAAGGMLHCHKVNIFESLND